MGYKTLFLFGPESACVFALLQRGLCYEIAILVIDHDSGFVVVHRAFLAVGVDIDACGLVTLSMHGKKVVPKDVEALKELKASTKLPFIVKGIMTVEDAMLAVEAGVDAIVVSNHGGRVLDCTPGAADVLPAIAEAVKGKVTILADGGVRSGVDVLKMIGLGADGVLIGRPFVTASFGGAKEGVKLYVDKLIDELEATMRLTGCQSVKDIDGKVIFR